MAVTPAILILILSQSLTKMLVGAFISTSRGRFVESSFAVYRDLRSKFRDLERDLILYHEGINHTDTLHADWFIDEIQASTINSVSQQGRLLSHLHRIHKSLLINSLHFESNQLKQLQVWIFERKLTCLSRFQEDLRDLSGVALTVYQRLAILERISRTYPFLLARYKSWGI